jgi:imidazoleglycerol-phosphate dehydratase/histidinol-phosphatase
MKRALFIDRDGTLIMEPKDNFQIDSLEKLEFYPKIFRNLYKIRKRLDYELVMVTNQDGLGTPSFPEEDFWPAHELLLKSLEGEGVKFDDIHIDRSFPHDNSPSRKPGTGMLSKYLNGKYDLANSYVIGDRLTDIQLAANLGAKGILVGEIKDEKEYEGLPLVFAGSDWDEIARFIIESERQSTVRRVTKETDIDLTLSLDGQGVANIDTGLGFFNHLLEQLVKHSGINMSLRVKGDLHVDEHHTIEDTGLAIGEALAKALGNKAGIERYGFVLPMDECLCNVAVDLGGRPCFVWDVNFTREKIGDVPTEMFSHFFKSLSDAARISLHIIAGGENEHHKIEGIFKAFAKSLRKAVVMDIDNDNLPSTKGIL